ncbi:MAG: sigma 54-interacting transcriptional regulator [Myxococcaceae bacterium]|nr:sigma 54-interacting transcriptional regulator [Myxococcaceae bacterium]
MTQQRTWVTRVAGGARRALQEYTLEVVKGPDRGQRVRVRAARFRVGALDGNDLKLTDPSVSGLHLELSHDERGVRVHDLGSRNGTIVNGVQVADAFLTSAATLELGSTQVAFTPEAGSVEVEALSVERFGPLVGKSVVMRELFARLQSFAARDATVLIHGETGSGKELVAEALVQASPRAERPLVVVDCSALAPSLVESELFGHEKGAFTGAVAQRAGAFERAHGGTVFLDEIGELPLELQPRLLRALERREVQRLGGKGPIGIDVRVLAATHRPLEEEVNQGRFRADLFYRLSVLRVDVPPLRDRRDDVAVLVQHFLGNGPTMDARTLERLASHPWPGNVRELRNAVERWKAGAEPLSPAPSGPQAGATVTATLDEPFLVQKERLVNTFEAAYAKALLEVSKGNLSEAARRAGVSRMAVVKMFTRLGLLG